MPSMTAPLHYLGAELHTTTAPGKMDIHVLWATVLHGICIGNYMGGYFLVGCCTACTLPQASSWNYVVVNKVQNWLTECSVC